MLLQSQVDSISLCLSDIYNLTINVDSQNNGTWTPVAYGLKAHIADMDSVERIKGQEIYKMPVDGLLKVIYNPNIFPGCRITIVSVNGIVVTGSEKAKKYQILSVDDTLTLGVQQECRVSKRDYD